MAKSLNISTARRTLPTLFDRVTARDGEKVVIHRRDGDQEAVLVSRGYLDRLEKETRRGTGTAFKLIGSGRMLGSVEEAVAEVRAAEAAEAEKRARELGPSRKRARR